jgi:hypothetical protein
MYKEYIRLDFAGFSFELLLLYDMWLASAQAIGILPGTSLALDNLALDRS